MCIRDRSSGGKTITTTEPKFIPKEAVEININDNSKVKVRLIDCVGYMVDGAAGHMEEDVERMVKTPWSTEEITFTQAAQIGTCLLYTSFKGAAFWILGSLPLTLMIPESRMLLL